MPCLTAHREILVLLTIVAAGSSAANAGEVEYPPRLPNNGAVAAITGPELLLRPSSLKADVQVATTAPRVTFLYYPAQDYAADTWSCWGDGSVAGGKYYSAIGDHNAPTGNAFVFEYDPERKRLRTLLDLQSALRRPKGHYSPGKIHSRIEMGRDGWLYFSTHRGSTRVTTEEYHFEGDWVLRHHPVKNRTEIVVHGPVEKHGLPTGMLDPERLIFYGGTINGRTGATDGKFFAWDLKGKRLLQTAEDGPYRSLILAQSTGCVYYMAQEGETLMKYNPVADEPPRPIPGRIGLRSATHETTDGCVYTVSNRPEALLWRFNTRTDAITPLGSAVVGSEDYIASLDADPTGRYLYYIPGAHGGSYRDGTPIVQYDTRTRVKKVLAFLHPALQTQVGYVPLGTFSSALSADAATLFVTWNGSRSEAGRNGRFPWDTCALTAIEIPESERLP